MFCLRLGTAVLNSGLALATAERAVERRAVKQLLVNLVLYCRSCREEGGQHSAVCAALPPSRFHALPPPCMWDSSSSYSWLSLALG